MSSEQSKQESYSTKKYIAKSYQVVLQEPGYFCQHHVKGEILEFTDTKSAPEAAYRALCLWGCWKVRVEKCLKTETGEVDIVDKKYFKRGSHGYVESLGWSSAKKRVKQNREWKQYGKLPWKDA
jgi:hypothetical protein